jgi:hypothetical protein
MNNIRALVKEAREKGVDLTLPEDKGYCAISIGEYKGSTIFLYFFPGGYSNLIVKIEKELHDCEEALFCPRGLFITLFNNKNDIIYKLVNKLKILLSLEHNQ